MAIESFIGQVDLPKVFLELVNNAAALLLTTQDGARPVRVNLGQIARAILGTDHVHDSSKQHHGH